MKRFRLFCRRIASLSARVVGLVLGGGVVVLELVALVEVGSLASKGESAGVVLVGVVVVGVPAVFVVLPVEAGVESVG